MESRMEITRPLKAVLQRIDRLHNEKKVLLCFPNLTSYADLFKIKIASSMRLGAAPKRDN